MRRTQALVLYKTKIRSGTFAFFACRPLLFSSFDSFLLFENRLSGWVILSQTMLGEQGIVLIVMWWVLRLLYRGMFCVQHTAASVGCCHDSFKGD